ncbi:MAG: 50S ribosomal protein L18 [Gaiellales bacterium]|mgnify:CR=1 FL=1|nr:50S ribosomal protein L18 [Gaiellales bacterium]
MSILENKQHARDRRALRVRGKVQGTTERPRLSVFRSNRFIYAQLIDDTSGRVLASAGGRVEAGGPKKDQADRVGELIAQRAKEVGVARAVFDRGPYLYHGRVKALAEGARRGGLEF